MKILKCFQNTLLFIFVLGIAYFCISWWLAFQQTKLLKEVVERLSADSRVAEAIVSKVSFDGESGKKLVTIKFVEYSSSGQPLDARYFTFSSDIIYFETLVIRFDDLHIKKGHPLKGKSAYLFRRAFALVGDTVEQYEITPINTVPQGYQIGKKISRWEQRLWQYFWEYALKEDVRKKEGIKNAQIEAPATKFVLGFLYTLKIEHDGGLRIDVQKIPPVLQMDRV
ncbi:MAG: hypothetical protein N2606_04465 [Candidatus Omnitrophica bacterium]|nr:hypothetical protein [Candidatus Omnitrophota bacterium]